VTELAGVSRRSVVRVEAEMADGVDRHRAFSGLELSRHARVMRMKEEPPNNGLDLTKPAQAMELRRSTQCSTP